MLYTPPLGAMRVLGLDVGSKTIGVAVADPTGLIASPHSVLARRGHAADAKAVAALVRDTDAAAVVVGLPLELDGTAGHRARLVDAFVAALTAALADPAAPTRVTTIHRWDERFSTAAAERTLLEADVSRARRRRVVDALAAQFILQGWLEARRTAAARAASPENPA
jgi:putative Holliday junction resolvase